MLVLHAGRGSKFHYIGQVGRDFLTAQSAGPVLNVNGLSPSMDLFQILCIEGSITDFPPPGQVRMGHDDKHWANDFYWIYI